MFRNLSVQFFLFAILLALLATLSQQDFVRADDTAVDDTDSKIVVSIAQDAPTWLNDALYTIDPDGQNLTQFFDFSNQPKQDSGRMVGLRANSNGRHLYFHSTHLQIYTPAYYNVFQLNTVGKQLDQVTPGPESGEFSQSGNSIVSGYVRNNVDTPYVGSPVYLEGVGTVNTGGDGSFSFSNVPAGTRWLMAYNNTLDLWEARAITVVANLNITDLALVPDTSSRLNFEYAVPYGNRIYYRGNGGTEVNWTTADFDAPTNVYTSPSDFCTGLPTVDAFDVHQSSGKIVVFDYQEGCGGNSANHAGLYTLDENGGNKTLLFNMFNDFNYGGPLNAQVFWSPDGTKIAAKVSYNFVDHVVIFDTSGTLLGFANVATTTAVLTLYGWDNTGNYLLYSEYDGDATQADLGKIVVNADGSMGAATVLLTDQPISGAVWGNFATAKNLFLPMIQR